MSQRQAETFCHSCFGAHRVDGHQTEVLQAVVATWLIDFNEMANLTAGQSYEAQATELLALIAQTLRAHKPPVSEF